jgi:hypothetical protein
MKKSEQDEIRDELGPQKKKYTPPILTEYGDLSKYTQGALVLSVITPLTATLADIATG